jgi:N6-adenosine-specific RNA methylase IME4
VKKYQIIYADPPWSYNLFSGVGQEKKKSRTASSHYEVMRFVEICDLPIKNLADDNCVLFMWATYPMLPEAIHLIRQWGFAYKTVAFTWVKKNKLSDSWFWGMGTWTRANPEICILATKGNPGRVSKSVHSVLDDRIREHSRKPDTAKDRIVQLMGDLPRIELFARQKTDGWDVWGNEVKSDIAF